MLVAQASRILHMKHRKDTMYRLTFRRIEKVEYYRQLKSIYAYHTRDEIGCQIGHLYDSNIEADKPFSNKKVLIEVIEVR